MPRKRGNDGDGNGDDENFTNYPKSLTEKRADDDPEGGASKWLPRDVLISILRKIDRGELKPDYLIVITREDDQHRSNWSRCGPSHDTSIGIMVDAIWSMCSKSRSDE